MSENRVEIEMIVAEVAPAAPGLEAVRQCVLDKCRAIAEALGDLSEVIDTRSATYALDLSEAKSVRLYLVADGWLHVFAGPVDPQVPVQSRDAINPRFPTACRHRATPITSSSRFEYEFHGNTGPLVAPPPAVLDFTDAVRAWRFEVGEESLRLEFPATGVPSALEAEHDRFVHRLAGLILACHVAGPEPKSFAA